MGFIGYENSRQANGSATCAEPAMTWSTRSSAERCIQLLQPYEYRYALNDRWVA